MSIILDHNGKPFEKKLLKEPQTASLVHLQKQIADHPAKGITPERLNQILQDAESGDLKAQHELFEDMEERDGHVYSELSKRKRAVMGLDWEIAPPRSASKAEENDCAWVEEVLRDMPDLEDLFFDALGGISHGFAALEIEWQLLGKEWLINKLHHRPHAWFATDTATRNNLLLRNQGSAPEPLKPFGWMLHIHRAKSGYIARSGLGRVLVWPYLFKHYSVGDLAEFLDICGIPLRLGKYPNNATKNEKSALWRAVAGMGHAAAGIIPQSMQVEFQKAAQGSEKPFEAMIRWCENTQTKAITGNLPGNERGTASGIGSGIADLANEVRKEIRDSDAKQLAGTITQQLIYPLLAINKGWGDPRRLPRFRFDTIEAENLGTYADSLPKLVNIGMRIPPEWAHEKLRIPQAAKDESILQTAVPAPAAATKQDNNTPPARLTKLHSNLQAALKAQTDYDEFADQAALDDAMAHIVKDLQPQVEQWLEPALIALQQAPSAEAALEMLTNKAPMTNDDVLIDAIARAMFVSELLGVDSVLGELNDS